MQFQAYYQGVYLVPVAGVLHSFFRMDSNLPVEKMVICAFSSICVSIYIMFTEIQYALEFLVVYAYQSRPLIEMQRDVLAGLSVAVMVIPQGMSK